MQYAIACHNTDYGSTQDCPQSPGETSYDTRLTMRRAANRVPFGEKWRLKFLSATNNLDLQSEQLYDLGM